MPNRPKHKRRASCSEISGKINCSLLCTMTKTIIKVQGLGIREPKQPWEALCLSAPPLPGPLSPEWCPSGGFIYPYWSRPWRPGVMETQAGLEKTCFYQDNNEEVLWANYITQANLGQMWMLWEQGSRNSYQVFLCVAEGKPITTTAITIISIAKMRCVLVCNLSPLNIFWLLSQSSCFLWDSREMRRRQSQTCV